MEKKAVFEILKINTHKRCLVKKTLSSVKRHHHRRRRARNLEVPKVPANPAVPAVPATVPAVPARVPARVPIVINSMMKKKKVCHVVICFLKV